MTTESLTIEQKRNLLRRVIEEIDSHRDGFLETECKLDAEGEPRLDTLPAESKQYLDDFDEMLRCLHLWAAEIES